MVSTDEDGDKIQYIVNWGNGWRRVSDFVENGVPMEFGFDWMDSNTYVVKVKAFDGEEYSDITEITITIEDDSEQTSTLNFPLILLLLASAAVLVTFFVIYMRKKNKK